MRIKPEELSRHLQRGLAAVYVLTGDEPLQMGEAADAIRGCAREQGFGGREVLEAEAGFDWGRLAAEAQTLSLFAEKRLIDLRIHSGKPGTEGGKVLDDYASALPPDTLLLVTLPRLERAQLSSKWFKALERVGVTVQVWPLEGARLGQWIDQRMRSRGLAPAGDAVAVLQDRIEGNLLAAAQEIDKLLLVLGPGRVTADRVAASVADSARFDVFKLVDAALDGATGRCVRILDGLRGEGTAPAVVLWALSREIRLLASLAREVKGGRSPRQVVQGRREVWERRKPLVAKGLGRHDPAAWQALLLLCAQTDRAIKGRERRDPWRLLMDIATRVAGAPALPESKVC